MSSFRFSVFIRQILRPYKFNFNFSSTCFCPGNMSFRRSHNAHAYPPFHTTTNRAAPSPRGLNHKNQFCPHDSNGFFHAAWFRIFTKIWRTVKSVFAITKRYRRSRGACCLKFRVYQCSCFLTAWHRRLRQHGIYKRLYTSRNDIIFRKTPSHPL